MHVPLPWRCPGIGSKVGERADLEGAVTGPLVRELHIGESVG